MTRERTEDAISRAGYRSPERDAAGECGRRHRDGRAAAYASAFAFTAATSMSISFRVL